MREEVEEIVPAKATDGKRCVRRMDRWPGA